MDTFGKGETFVTTGSLTATSPTTFHVPRWFYYGKQPFIRYVKTQLVIVKEMEKLSFWKKWYQDQSSTTRDQSDQINSICNAYGIDNPSTIRSILFYSNQVV